MASLTGSLLGTPTRMNKSDVLKVLAQPVSNADPQNSLAKTQQLVKAMHKARELREARAVDTETLIPLMIGHLASNNAEIKGLVCDFLVQAASEKGTTTDVGLLAAASLSTDVKDANPTIRAQAITALCTIPSLAEEHAVKAILTGLQDSNMLVRKAAVTGTGKLWRHSPDVIDEHNLVDRLYLQIRDQDTLVVTFAMQTINVILSAENGIVINTTMARYLLQRLADFTSDKELCFVFDYLKDYHFAGDPSEDCVVDLINALDKYLDNGANSPQVFLAAASLFYVAAVQPEAAAETLIDDFLEKLRPQISRILKSTTQVEYQDFQVRIIEFIMKLRPAVAEKMSRAHLRDLQLKSRKVNSIM